jgi:putative FmdB family regulatory protein
MPVYEYRCENGHTFDVVQRMSDDPVAVCQQCGAPVQRVFHPVAVHFKGSGFYATDYGKKKAPSDDSAGKKDSDAGGSKDAAKSDSSSSKSDSPAKSGSGSASSD